MKYYGMVVLVAIAVSTAGCDRQIQPRPEVNRPAPAMTIFEEPVTVGHEPEIIGPTEQLRYPRPMPRGDALASVDSQTAPVQSATPANNNPPPAPLRQRSDVVPMPCSEETEPHMDRRWFSINNDGSTDLIMINRCPLVDGYDEGSNEFPCVIEIDVDRSTDGGMRVRDVRFNNVLAFNNSVRMPISLCWYENGMCSVLTRHDRPVTISWRINERRVDQQGNPLQVVENVDDSMLGQRVGGKTCIMELILNKDFSIRGARMLDGRIFTYDPTRNRLLEQVATQTETPADKPWYAVSRAELERDVFPVIAIGMGILFLVLLARAMVRSRRDNHQWPWGYRDRPYNRDRVTGNTTAPTPSSHNHRGGLTEQEFRGLSRAEQIRLERAMVDIEIESAREAAQFARQRRRSTLDLEQFLAREDRKLIEARVEADLLIIEAAGDAEIARLNALEAEYDAAKEETEGGFVDDDLFEDAPAATVPSAEDIDDALEQSGFGKDDGFDPDGNV